MKTIAPIPPAFQRQRLVQYFFFAMFLLLLWQVLRILSPFYLAILGAAVLSLMTYPLHAWVRDRIPKYPSLAAGLSTTVIFLMVIIPIVLLGWMSVRETSKIYPFVRDWVNEADFSGAIPLQKSLPPRVLDLGNRALDLASNWGMDPTAMFLDNLNQLSRTITELAKALIKNAVFFVFNIIVLTFTLFFFLRDGPFLIRRTIELVPMAPRNKQAIVNKLKVTLFAVIRGLFVVAVIQGILAGIGYALFGVPFPVFLGLLTTFLAPIPIVGPATIWLPVSVGLCLSGAIGNGIAVFLWGLCVVSLIDNVLRPVLISAEAKLPILLLFFGMLGGLKIYGVSGMILGPITIALLMAFMNIYRREYRWLLNPPNKEG